MSSSCLIALYVHASVRAPERVQQEQPDRRGQSQGLYGVITIGVAVLIITGAIDLSIGSVVGFSAVAFGLMMTYGIHIAGVQTGPIHPYLAVPIVLALGVVIGLINGLLVTRLKLQAFLVTLCGLFVYRGLARYMTRSPVGTG